MTRTPRLAWLLEYALMVWIVGVILATACALSVAFDLHFTRLEFQAANAEWRRETFRRLDQLMWKADTALELAGAARLDLGNLLTKIRAQVKQSTDVTAAASQKQTQAATAAVTKAIDTTTRAIEAVAGEPARPVEDPAPAVERPPVTVNVPPPTVITEKPAAPAVEVKALPAKRRRRWVSFLWPGHWRP